MSKSSETLMLLCQNRYFWIVLTIELCDWVVNLLQLIEIDISDSLPHHIFNLRSSYVTG